MIQQQLSDRSLKAPIALAALLTLVFAGVAGADEVYLKDGSKLIGEVQRLSEAGLAIQTEFAGTLAVKAESVKGLSTDQKLTVQTPTGDRVTGRLVYDPQVGQKLTETAFGDLVLDDAQFAAIWSGDEPNPRLEELKQEHAEAVESLKAAQEKQLEDVKSGYEKQLTAANEKIATYEDPWSGRLQFGLTGSTGNTEELGFRGRAEVRRTTDNDRLLLYAQGTYNEQNNIRTKNEILGGARLEVDISDRWFAYGKGELEFDEFEDLDLRSTVTGGVGYFFIQEEKHELKGRAGVGYQHESFDDGTTSDEGVLELGYDYRLDLDEWLRFTHSLTYYPAFGDPLSDYRLAADTGAEIPIGATTNEWKIRTGMRNEYDAQPRPGIERLDTTYYIDLVYDWD